VGGRRESSTAFAWYRETGGSAGIAIKEEWARTRRQREMTKPPQFGMAGDRVSRAGRSTSTREVAGEENRFTHHMETGKNLDLGETL